MTANTVHRSQPSGIGSVRALNPIAMAVMTQDRCLRRNRTEVRLRLSGLRREGDGSRPGEGAGELGEDRQVGVKPDPLDASDPQRQ